MAGPTGWREHRANAGVSADEADGNGMAELCVRSHPGARVGDCACRAGGVGERGCVLRRCPEVVARNRTDGRRAPRSGAQAVLDVGGPDSQPGPRRREGGDGRRRRDHSGAGRRRPGLRLSPQPAVAAGLPEGKARVLVDGRRHLEDALVQSSVGVYGGYVYFGARHPTIALRKQPGSSARRSTALARPSGSRWNPMARRRSWSRAATWSG